MTYEDWCKNSNSILAQADTYNAWRKHAMATLLTNLGPRIAAVGKSGYYGCGFHYALEKTFGNLITKLALPWQPSANHVDKIEAAMTSNMINEIIFEEILRDVWLAEQTAKELSKPELYEALKAEYEAKVKENPEFSLTS